MLALSRIHLATKEDRQYQLDHWDCSLQNEDMEELQMLAQNNHYFKEASETVISILEKI